MHMMNQKHVEAKLQLATAFAELAGQTPPERITINMIVDRLGKHRKTFYYHFTGKEQLIIWLFRYELGCALSERFEENLLVYEPEGSSCYADFPYYVHNLKESGRIYHAPFFSVLASVLERRRQYYRNILSFRGPGTFDQYLHRLYYPAIEDDIAFLVRREIERLNPIEASSVSTALKANDCVDFLAQFYTDAFITRFVERLNYSARRRSVHDIYPFENVVHDSLEALVEQQIRRLASKSR